MKRKEEKEYCQTKVLEIKYFKGKGFSIETIARSTFWEEK